MEMASAAAPLGVEYLCLDAGWFDDGFPHGVGNWTVDQTKFPDGLKPVADHVHRLGMKFGKPEAQKLILETISRYVTEVGVDWIRYDFNIAPLGFWQAAEGQDEQGLAQLRYMNGLYDMLAKLMARHPNLLIEQCASGGRRIDLETVRYGHT